MEERGNKTIICSVFFLDIIEYSKKPVSGQISLKERFNAFLSTAIRDVPINDRIILDTGDGAAISFLGDVEDALRAALSMRSSLMSEEGQKAPPLLVRMGVNLGPVRLVKDINGQPNIVGDGINVAQRVMAFSEPGQILVSRSYYDAASRLSQEYAGMFHYEGARTDKHVREHEVYAIGYPGDLTVSQQSFEHRNESKFNKALMDFRAKCKDSWIALVARHNDLVIQLSEKYKLASSQQKAMYAGLIGVPLLLVLALVIKLAYKSDVSPQKALPKEVVAMSAVSTEQVKSGVASASPSAGVNKANPVKNIQPPQDQKTKQHLVKENKKEKEKKSEKVAKTEKKPDSPLKQEKTERVEKQEKADGRTGQTSRSAANVSQGQGEVLLTVKPWGEIYLDGKMVGISPPMHKLKVSEGAHTIEIRNTTFPSYQRAVDIKAGEVEEVKYKFPN